VTGHRELVERFITSLEARDWDNWARLLHPGVIYEIPQSRERIRGVIATCGSIRSIPATGT
jgi:hypothetical protein